MRLGHWMRAEQAARWMRACSRIGPDLRLHGRPVIKNFGRLEIGARFQFSSSPAPSHIAVWPGGALEIGDGVSIGHGAAIGCQTLVRIGAGSSFGPFVVLADSDFHVAGDRYATPLPRPIDIGRGVHLGARVTVMPGTIIGEGAHVAAGSAVSGVVPAGARVAGVPARDQRLLVSTGSAGALDQQLQALIARVLGLPGLPALSDGPREIAGWDSLGALRILLAVEDECGVQLDERDLARLTSVAALVESVEAKRARA